MRKLFVYMVILLVCAGCEVIQESDRLIPFERETDGTRKHVLIEFTGFRCVNCPDAAKQAQLLQEQYSEELVAVSMHPASNPFTQGRYDYTCPAADSIYRLMGGDASTPFPTGNINMTKYKDSYFIDPSEWATVLLQEIRDSVNTTPLSDATVSYWLIEDSVKGVQAMPDNSVNTEYYHRHVLRAIAQEEHFEIQSGWDSTHLSVLKILSDPNDNHILQAYEKKIDFSSTMPAGNE